MNILYTESSSNVGGQELQAVAQMSALKALGHSVMLACRKNSGIALEAQKKGISTVYIPFRNSLHIPSIRALYRFIRHFSPQLVVCHSGHDSNITGITWRLMAGRFRIIRQKTYLPGRVKPFALNYLCDVVVPGHAAKDALLRGGCRNAIHVVPPGFDFAAMRLEVMAPLPAKISRWLSEGNQNAPVILQVGMLRPEKGHNFMLDTLFNLRAQGRSFRWLIIGGGTAEEESALRKQIQNAGMDDITLMAGSIFPVYPVYRIAQLLVVPSRKETFGMVVSEAAAFMVPVIASCTGGLPDIIKSGKTGTLLSVGDRDAWLSALHDFFTHPDHYYQMACMAKQDVEKRFDIQRCVQRLLAAGHKNQPEDYPEGS